MLFFTVAGWEFFGEIIPRTKKFLDWHFSQCENQLWIGSIHVVFNRVVQDESETGGWGGSSPGDAA